LHVNESCNKNSKRNALSDSEEKISPQTEKYPLKIYSHKIEGDLKYETETNEGRTK
jgi:hypothetical protein